MDNVKKLIFLYRKMTGESSLVPLEKSSAKKGKEDIKTLGKY